MALTADGVWGHVPASWGAVSAPRGGHRGGSCVPASGLGLGSPGWCHRGGGAPGGRCLCRGRSAAGGALPLEEVQACITRPEPPSAAPFCSGRQHVSLVKAVSGGLNFCSLRCSSYHSVLNPHCGCRMVYAALRVFLGFYFYLFHPPFRAQFTRTCLCTCLQLCTHTAPHGCSSRWGWEGGCLWSPGQTSGGVCRRGAGCGGVTCRPEHI